MELNICWYNKHPCKTIFNRMLFPGQTTREIMLANGEQLSKLHHRLMLEYMPIIVLMAITGIFGVVGNIVTFLFYNNSPRTSTSVLIAGLAVVDTIICLLSLTTAARMVINVMLTSKILCKLMYFSYYWMTYTSVMILSMIAVDRYLKICRPQWRQLTVRTSLKSILIVVALYVLVSLRFFVTFDIVQVSFKTDGDVSQTYDNITNVSFIGYYCMPTDDVTFQAVSLGFQIFDMLLFPLFVLNFVFCYGNIVKTLVEHRKKMTASLMDTKNVLCASTTVISTDGISRTANLSRSPGSSINTEWSQSREVDFRLTSDEGNTPPESDDTGRSPTENKTIQHSSTKLKHFKHSERNVTIMMLVVTIVFFVCFVPYFVVKLLVRKQVMLAPIVQFVLRLPFLNSVANPVIFVIFNPRYRFYVKGLINRCR